jgi:hypothetical protein
MSKNRTCDTGRKEGHWLSKLDDGPAEFAELVVFYLEH